MPDKIQLVTEDEAEDCEAVVCMPLGYDSPFTDNLTGECSRCGRSIIYRPSAPKTPPKVCIDCGLGMMQDAEDTGDEVVVSTKSESLYEAILAMAKSHGRPN